METHQINLQYFVASLKQSLASGGRNKSTATGWHLSVPNLVRYGFVFGAIEKRLGQRGQRLLHVEWEHESHSCTIVSANNVLQFVVNIRSSGRQVPLSHIYYLSQRDHHGEYRYTILVYV